MDILVEKCIATFVLIFVLLSTRLCCSCATIDALDPEKCAANATSVAFAHFDSSDYSVNVRSRYAPAIRQDIPLLADISYASVEQFPFIVLVITLDPVSKAAIFVSTGVILHNNLVITSSEAVERWESYLARELLAGIRSIKSSKINNLSPSNNDYINALAYEQPGVQMRRCEPWLLLRPSDRQVAADIAKNLHPGSKQMALKFLAQHREQLLIVKNGVFDFRNQLVKPICLESRDTSVGVINDNTTKADMVDVISKVFAGVHNDSFPSANTIPIVVGYASGLPKSIKVPCVVIVQTVEAIDGEFYICPETAASSPKGCSCLSDLTRFAHSRTSLPGGVEFFNPVMLPYDSISKVVLWHYGERAWVISHLEVWVPKEKTLNPYYDWDDNSKVAPLGEYRRYYFDNVSHPLHIVQQRKGAKFNLAKAKTVILKRLKDSHADLPENLDSSRIIAWANFPEVVTDTTKLNYSYDRDKFACHHNGIYCMKTINYPRHNQPLGLGMPWLVARNNRWYMIGLSSRNDYLSDDGTVLLTSSLAFDQSELVTALRYLDPADLDKLQAYYDAIKISVFQFFQRLPTKGSYSQMISDQLKMDIIKSTQSQGLADNAKPNGETTTMHKNNILNYYNKLFPQDTMEAVAKFYLLNLTDGDLLAKEALLKSIAMNLTKQHLSEKEASSQEIAKVGNYFYQVFVASKEFKLDHDGKISPLVQPNFYIFKDEINFRKQLLFRLLFFRILKKELGIGIPTNNDDDFA